MNLLEHKIKYESSFVPEESVLLKFIGLDGYDVYNCSLPFIWDGKKYIFGRVERHEEWMRSWVRLFEEVEMDTYRLADNSMIYQLEDPYVSIIQNELILGGTHVRMSRGKLDTFYGYFYRGFDVNDMYYFTSGPDHMKDIRLVELSDGRVGVFSRPRGDELIEKYGTDAMIGFTVVDSLDDLSAEVIEHAEAISGIFEEGQWGGCNQAYLLSGGMVGVVGHLCCSYMDKNGVNQSCYTSMSFVLDPDTKEIFDYKLIGTRKLFPCYVSKRNNLEDCIFPSGIVMREDGRADLYCGLSDCAEGRIVIEYPFANHGSIIK